MTDPHTSGLQPFHAMEILAEARALEAEGRDICHLEVGEPGAPPAPAVREAVRRHLDEPQTYTHAKGLIELRRALAQSYAERYGAEVDPDSIVVTMGSSAGFILAFLASLPLGAVIAVTRPGYPAYLNTIAGLGFQPVEIPLSAANGWRLTPHEIEQAHQRLKFDALLFASPANPTGAAVDGHGMAAIVDTCRRLGVRLISDEIYHGLDYGGASVSAREFGTDAIIVNSFSKYHCMTGWRIGWLVLPDELVRKAEILQQNLFISAPTLSQIAGIAALGAIDYAEEQKAAYLKNRALLSAGLDRLGFVGAVGEGAFYHYVDISAFSNDSLFFCKTLLRDGGVAATPGIDFDRVDGNRFVRFSYAGTRAVIEEALVRISRFVES